MILDTPEEILGLFHPRMTRVEMERLWHELARVGCAVTRAHVDAEAAHQDRWQISVRHPGWTGALYPRSVFFTYQQHADGTWERITTA